MVIPTRIKPQPPNKALVNAVAKTIEAGFTVSDPYYHIQGSFGLGYIVTENHDVSSLSGEAWNDVILQFKGPKAAAKHFVGKAGNRE